MFYFLLFWKVKQHNPILGHSILFVGVIITFWWFTYWVAIFVFYVLILSPIKV